MDNVFDPIRALGTIPHSHVARFRFLSEAHHSDVATISRGVLFFIAFWSGPSMQALVELKRVLAAVDPGGELQLVVVDTDGCADLCEMAEFRSNIHGWGEAAWIKNGKICRTSGMGFHPECFEPFTRQFLEESRAEDG